MVGVLAFHGDVAEHCAVLQRLGQPHCEVRTLGDLKNVDRLIIPGGESTVIAMFLKITGVGEEIVRRVKCDTLAVYGTCAGAILLAKNVLGKHPPPTLGLMDITVERNAYGTQLQSFEAELRVRGLASPITVSFIRAPRIGRVGETVEVLSEHGGYPVLVRQGRLLAGTFHSEVRGEVAVHELFLRL